MKKKLNYGRFLLPLLSMLVLLFLTGCWSSKEIEEFSLVLAVALDKGKESTIEKEIKDRGGGYPKRNLITSTYQIASQQTGSKGDGAQQKRYVNISETGDSIHQMIREFSLRRDRPLFASHLKVIVISENLVRTYSLEQLLEQYLRENESRLSCLVLISKGRASETLESKEIGEIPAFHLIGIGDNQYRTTRILPPVSLAKLEGKMQSGSSFLLQNVISTNGEIKFAGAAAIKGKTNKLRGFLNEEELEGLIWINGKRKGGVVKAFDKKTGQPIIYEIKSIKSKITPHVNGNTISFDVNIESVGRLSENWTRSGKAVKNEFLKRTEKAVEQEVTRLVNHVTEKMQKKYQVDVAGFGNRLRIKNPKTWKKVKKDWDRTFSKVLIKYHVNVTIEDYGASNFKK
ncbi:Ger(x)C family spore germination protein [Bacillus gaemokensis]|uniref:Spore gernimation protein GerC n=1 Tax=Bacillus gaemokensis TaxID=574375 RepID=A0A073K708_9BACI|nr:Ger(x)C family spore germination protein [Bacillus gaemokensis]KEK22321.1 spore gernimation protein GerC [Bacillus gaemokensis]KYG36594.1 spore gernimation protein GerC [Bacillus gaemokensis]